MVRRTQIYCIRHPEWGTWGIYEDCGDWFEIHGDSGDRVLFKEEFNKDWAIINN